MIYRNGNNQIRGGMFNPISLRDDKNVNLEISYDNFDTVNLDMERKRQYAQDLRSQMEENQRKKREALEKKKLDDLADELRLKREQELIDQRQKEENKRYRPKIDLPIQKLEMQKEEKKVRKMTPNVKYVTQEVNRINRNYLNENTLNYLRSREMQIDNFNDRILEQLRLLNNDFENNINTLKGEIGLLNDMNEKNKRYKDQLYKEVNLIKENLDNRKPQDNCDSRNIYELMSRSDYNKYLLGNIHNYETMPKRYQVRKFITRGDEIGNRFFIDDEKKSDGLKLYPYVNLSHVISYDTPRYKSNDDSWIKY
jgi:hypothetical protein